MRDSIKYVLNDSDFPRDYYNILPDLPQTLDPVLHPGTGRPIGIEDLAPLFPISLIMQENSTERWIEIPEEVRNIYRHYRPSPLFRARRLEEGLDTPAHIYFKYEGGNPAGSHKLNTAIAQAYYNKVEGVKKLVTETGAGQWGSALSLACSMFDMACEIFMVKISYNQKPYRRIMMETYGATVHPSPTTRTVSGRSVLAETPLSNGSLSIAISEAVETAMNSDGTCKYCLGSVLNHVMLHQTIIGVEAIKQMEMAGEYPDIVIGCVGGGSNFAGLAFPFMPERFSGRRNTRFIAVEPTSTPCITKGIYTYDYGDMAGLTPLLRMHTLGHRFMPAGIHAGGLRYHGVAPTVSALVKSGYIEGIALPQTSTLTAAIQFARSEGIIPAPESAHAIRAAIDQALRAKRENRADVILFNLSGHGMMDLPAYRQYLDGVLEDYEHPTEALASSLAHLPEY